MTPFRSCLIYQALKLPNELGNYLGGGFRFNPPTLRPLLLMW